MFKVLSGETKRRTLSPAALAASVAAHLLLLGGLVYASTGEPKSRERLGPTIELPPLPEEKPVVEPPAPPPPAPAQPEQPSESSDPPVPGETLQLDAPDDVPDAIPEPRTDVQPVDPEAYSGVGRIGDVIGTPGPERVPPSGNVPAAPPVEDLILTPEMVEELPVLDRGDLGRALERHYPAVLRDARVGGRVLIEVIVDENGRVRPGSARVVESSHGAFGEATLRAVDRFRFRPAKVAGVPVPVRVTIPIQWTVPR